MDVMLTATPREWAIYTTPNGKPQLVFFDSGQDSEIIIDLRYLPKLGEVLEEAASHV